MKKSIRIVRLAILALLLTVCAPDVAKAQCPMCRMSAESNLANGGTAGKGLNRGILLMFSMPYVMVGTIGYFWYRNRRKEEEVDFDKL
jgi:hypothetical protein